MNHFLFSIIKKEFLGILSSKLTISLENTFSFEFVINILSLTFLYSQYTILKLHKKVRTVSLNFGNKSSSYIISIKQNLKNKKTINKNFICQQSKRIIFGLSFLPIVLKIFAYLYYLIKIYFMLMDKILANNYYD